MSSEFLDIVDLGTKQGSAMHDFITKSGKTVLPADMINAICRSRCVGYEREQGEKYRRDVTDQGFQFRIADLATDHAIAALPLSQVYLAWHFLEHVPNKDWSRKLVRASLSRARTLAWFRLPSFEQDCETGEGFLRQHGMRFTWTNWLGHPTHWLVSDCTEAVENWGKDVPSRPYRLTVKPGGYMRSMADERIVPIDAPVDVTEYHPQYGPKPLNVVLPGPLVSEWEVIVSFG